MAATPKPVWSIEVPTSEDFDAQWLEVPDVAPYTNSYRAVLSQQYRTPLD